MLKKIMILPCSSCSFSALFLQNAYLEETFASLSSQVAAVEEAFTAGDHSAARLTDGGADSQLGPGPGRPLFTSAARRDR